MDQSPIDKKELLIGLGISLTIVIIIFLNNFFEIKTKVVFCQVGQGDATYIRVKNKFDLLVDAGPDRSVLNCLGRHMPFFDRTIELMILSHPQKDHYGGLVYLTDRYKIEKLLTVKDPLETKSFKKLQLKMEQKQTKFLFPLDQTKISFLGDEIEFLWPPESLVSNQVLGATTGNERSLIFQFKEGAEKILFTGDADQIVLDSLSQQDDNRSDDLLKTTILKVPHHGSKKGLSAQFLKLADPTLSVISVGKNNSYGHPAKEVLDIFKALNKKYVRTDEKGDVVLRLN